MHINSANITIVVCNRTLDNVKVGKSVITFIENVVKLK